MEPSLEERLAAADLWPAAPNGEVSIDLLLYDTPDAVLNLWRQQGQPDRKTYALVEGYRRLLQLRDGSRLISTWRLCQLNDDELLAWLHGQAKCPTRDTPPPVIDALSAVVTRRLLEIQSDALEAYLDLELQAELVGTSPDSNYIFRLDNSANGETLLEDWWQVAEQAAKANHLAEEVAQFNGEKEVLAQEKDAALQGADDLKQQLVSQAETLVEAQEENQRTLLQLHQVQEELESYFLKNREQDEQLQGLEGQLTELKREQAAISQARDAALETSANFQQQLAAELNALNQAQAKCDQQSKSHDDLTAQLQTKDQALRTAAANVSDLTYQLQERSKEMVTANKSVKEAQKEAALTLLQLHQVQEELEHYFLRASAGDQLCHAQAHENARAMGLLGRMIRLQAGL